MLWLQNHLLQRAHVILRQLWSDMPYATRVTQATNCCPILVVCWQAWFEAWSSLPESSAQRETEPREYAAWPCFKFRILKLALQNKSCWNVRQAREQSDFSTWTDPTHIACPFSLPRLFFLQLVSPARLKRIISSLRYTILFLQTCSLSLIGLPLLHHQRAQRFLDLAISFTKSTRHSS